MSCLLFAIPKLGDGVGIFEGVFAAASLEDELYCIVKLYGITDFRRGATDKAVVYCAVIPEGGIIFREKQ